MLVVVVVENKCVDRITTALVSSEWGENNGLREGSCVLEGTERVARRLSASLFKASALRIYFVPEGQHDRSLARSAWESVHRANRPVGHGMIGRS